MLQKLPGPLESQFLRPGARPRKGRRLYGRCPHPSITASPLLPEERPLGRVSKDFISLMVRDGAPDSASAARSAPPHHEELYGPLNPPPCPRPIGIAQPALENLAGILARQIGLDFQVFWYFVIGEQGLEMCADSGDVQR